MFQDALQSLLDWLSAVEPSLSTETAVMGDPETVQILIDNHKVRKVCYISDTKRKAWQKFWSDLHLILETYQANTKLVFWPLTKLFRFLSHRRFNVSLAAVKQTTTLWWMQEGQWSMKTKLKIHRNWRRGLWTCACAGKLSVPCLLPNKTGNWIRDNAEKAILSLHIS